MNFDRSIKPKPKPLLEFIPPNFKEYKSDYDLNIYYIHKDKLPLVRLNFILNAGSKFDPSEKKGLAYLTSMTIDESADGLNALQISDGFDLLGSNFSVNANNDTMNFSLQSLSENFEKSFELFSKILVKPDFNESDFLREKKKLITQILQSKDDPEYLADQIFEKIIFGNSNEYAFPILGYEDSVQLITNNDIVDYYQKFFSPQNSFLVAAGSIPFEGFIEIINKHLAGWRNNFIPQKLKLQSEFGKKNIFIFHKEGSVQSEIRTGHLSSKRNQEDYFQKLILNNIIGGQFASRINLNLRERNGYTYGASSRFQYFKDAAFFQVATSVNSDNTVNALNEIFFELDNLKNGISDEELEFAKSSVTKKFPMNFETYRQIVFNMAAKILFDLPDNYFEKYIQEINSVTKQEVETVAKDSIHNDRLVTLLIGDKNRLVDQLKNNFDNLFEVNLAGEIINKL